MADKHFRLGCDIGGTFTDFVLLGDTTGQIHVNKCLTTPADPSDAVEQGVRELGEQLGPFVAELDEVIHGTTLVINSIRLAAPDTAFTRADPPRVDVTRP